MSTINGPDFPDEEEEDDFNPQAEVGSDDEGDEKPYLIEDDEAEQPAPRSRSRSQPKDEDGVKDEDADKDGIVGFGRNADEGEEEGTLNEDVEEEGDGEQRERSDEDEDEEEDPEEEEEDEDDDIEGQPSRKRRRKNRRNQFIDVEAEVDEEDEEELEEDDELPGEEMHPDDLQELPPDADRDDRKHRELDQQREKAFQVSAEEEAARLNERYRQYGRQAKATGAAGGAVPQHLLLPGAEDPRIYRMKCRPGKEREIVGNINDRMLNRQHSREPIQILSVFERGGVMAGNLYIEARRQEDISPAVEGISHVFMGTKPTMIPLEEMPDLLRTKKTKQLEPGNFVRLRRGLYQGDLAAVEEVETNGTDVTLRIVPRLDYGLHEDANAPIDTDTAGKRKRVAKPLSQRPQPRLFSETEARKRHSKYLTRNAGLRDMGFTYQNREYINGYLIDTFRVNALQTENVNPTVEEATRFTSGGANGEESLDLTAIKATLAQSTMTEYIPGDKVELFRGEQKGVTGQAVEVYGAVVKMRVESAGKLRNTTIEAPIKDLRKLFREGDHVKVIGGSKYFDEVGMVVKMKDDKVTILTDSTQQEVTVFSKDLREATDSGGNMAGSKYALFDLVQLDASTVGCVIKVDRESLRVLDQTGSVRTLLPSAISNKLERRGGAVATDSNSNEMKVDDQIKEFSGEQKVGRILHLHRNFVFAQNRERAENAGVWVARLNNVVTVAAKGGRPQGNGVDLTKMNPQMKQNGAAGGGMMPPQQKGRDRWIGKTVKIRTGPNKGMMGIVKDASDDKAKVELHAKTKQISVPKEQLTLIDSHSGVLMKDPRLGVNVPGGVPGRTPAAGNFGRTPFGAGADGRTPAYAMATGSRTPSWKADAGAGGRTPAFAGGATAYGGYGGATAYGGGQTAYGGQTSYGGGSVWGGSASTWNANPASRTPAHNPGNKTPAYSGGLEAPTPGFNSAPTPGYTDQPTPGGFRGGGGNSYRTPASYDTPGGFPETPGAGYDDDGPRYD